MTRRLVRRLFRNDPGTKNSARPLGDYLSPYAFNSGDLSWAVMGSVFSPAVPDRIGHLWLSALPAPTSDVGVLFARLAQ